MTEHVSSPAAIAALRANVAAPFKRARAMPKSVHTSPEFAEAGCRHVFATDWLCAGRAQSLPDPGDCLTLDIAGEPVIILRDRAGVLHGMSNVCRHRMSVLLEDRGNVRSIVCPYHARTYNVDDSLRGAPAMTWNEDFCMDAVALPLVRVEDRQGWIMVTLNRDAPAPSHHLAGVERLVGHLPMQDYREVFLRGVPLGHQLEGAGREFHGKLPPAGLPRGYDRRGVGPEPDVLAGIQRATAFATLHPPSDADAPGGR